MLSSVTDHTMTLFSVTQIHNWTTSFNSSFSVALHNFSYIFLQNFLECRPSYMLFFFNSSSRIITCIHLGYITPAFPKLIASPFSIQRTDELISLTCRESLPYHPVHDHVKGLFLHLSSIHFLSDNCFECPISF